MDLIETVTASERKFEGKIVNLRVDTILLPDGKTGKREIVEHAPAVAIVPMADKETVLMVRQFRLAAGKALLEIPAGSCNPGEDPEVSAARELTEEIGMTPGRMIPLYGAFVAPGYTTEKIYGYLALDLQPKKAAPDEDEFVEVVPMRLDDIFAAIASGEIEDMKTVAGISLAARILPTL